METNIKGTSRRMYLTDDDLDRLKKISDKTTLSQTEVLNQICHAGLACLVDQNRSSIRLPLEFRISDPEAEAIREDAVQSIQGAIEAMGANLMELKDEVAGYHTTLENQTSEIKKLHEKD